MKEPPGTTTRTFSATNLHNSKLSSSVFGSGSFSPLYYETMPTGVARKVVAEAISPPKFIFGVTTWSLGIMVTCS
ncbi:hypothetical protein E2C01_080785 [Portunus trituberculatus]|uniref:Uncharacterized protein n=1 Tax=Portunus trituberculatus TaxID=210409 RepID=A0A5B7IX03_PORTR|nr:hypothetical protein [Portunus trituberculatus]